MVLSRPLPPRPRLPRGNNGIPRSIQRCVTYHFLLLFWNLLCDITMGCSLSGPRPHLVAPHALLKGSFAEAVNSMTFAPNSSDCWAEGNMEIPEKPFIKFPSQRSNIKVMVRRNQGVGTRGSQKGPIVGTSSLDNIFEVSKGKTGRSCVECEGT